MHPAGDEDVKRTAVLSLCLFLFGGLVGCGGGASYIQPPPPPPASKEFLYANGVSTISSYAIDANTGVPSAINSVTGAHGSTSLAVTPSGAFLYAIDETTLGIDALSVSNSGVLTPLTGSPFHVTEANPFLFNFLVLDSAGKFLYLDDKGTNQVIGFTIDNETGVLTAIAGGTASTGVGPQQIAVDPSSKFLYVPNQLDGTVSVFSISSPTGALTSVSGSPFLIESNTNSQPQGLAVHPSGKFIYVALFNSNGVAAFSVDGTSGALTAVAGSPFPTGTAQITQTSWVAVHPTGRFLYALSLLDANIYAFTIDQNSGALTPVAGSPFSTPPNSFGPVGVQGPIAIDPSGSFLYAAAGNAYVAGFKIDATTGALTPLSGSPLPISVPATGLVAATAP